MANIDWLLTGTVKNAEESRVKILGTRRDVTDPENPIPLDSYGPLSGPIETTEQKLGMLEDFKSLRIERKDKESAAQAILDTILASGSAALTTWENTNG